ncbi:MAG: hypothetical protein AAB871_01540, partial [Patescibacteria group bacterium]
ELPLSFQALNFLIMPDEAKPVAMSSSSHPDQKSWSQERKVEIKVEPNPGEIYSYSFSSNLDMLPDETADAVDKTLVFDNLPDGIYYFKLLSKAGDRSWQEAGVFQAQIDATPPEPFSVDIIRQPEILDGEPVLSFSAVDKMSGILDYKVKTGWGKFESASSPFSLKKNWFAEKIEVRAYDHAGNARAVEISYPAYVPTWAIWIAIGLLLILLGSAIYYKNRRKTKIASEANFEKKIV